MKFCLKYEAKKFHHAIITSYADSESNADVLTDVVLR